jgi:CHAT domain-containing protein
VIVSLWSVEDESTATLMQDLYAQLRKGVSKDVALQRAMNSVRGQKKWEHPFYWAPFVLVGDWKLR